MGKGLGPLAALVKPTHYRGLKAGDGMLRYAFFTDFMSGPKVVLWGDRNGLAKLQALLRQASDRGGLFNFADRSDFQSADGSSLVLVCRDRDRGMARAPDGTLTWELTRERADDFVELVAPLLDGKPGHQYLECGLPDEIAVMVSRGEYENLAP
jgi:hypothetical protein